jgi:Na+-driven multidrug efflux pump
VVFAVAKVISSDLSGRGKPEYSSIFAVITLGVTVILDIKLIPAMGIRGAALASSIAYCVDGVLLAAALKHEMGVKWKVLLMPTRSEFYAYKEAWLRLKSLLFPAVVGNS